MKTKVLVVLVVAVFVSGFAIQNASAAEQSFSSPEDLLFMEIPSVVVASGKAEKVEQAPANVYVITGQEMINRGYLTIFDLLKDLPGFTWNASVGNETNGAPVIRGITFQPALKVLLNGMALNDRGSSNYGWDNRLPVDGIDRVEFILGPYASLYGRNTFSGVLNIVTKDGEKLNGAVFTVKRSTNGTYIFRLLRITAKTA